MRHRKKQKKLGRNSSQRLQLLRNLACSLVRYERITTTLAKAKSLRKFVEPAVTSGKTKTATNATRIKRKIPERQAAHKLFNGICPKYSAVSGGYTRITKVKLRSGDGATQCLIEFV